MTAFLTGLLEIVKGIIAKMPVLSLEAGTVSSISSAFSVIVNWVKIVNFMVPLDQILIVVGIILTFRAAKFGIFIFNWVVRRVADFFP